MAHELSSLERPVRQLEPRDLENAKTWVMRQEFLAELVRSSGDLDFNASVRKSWLVRSLDFVDGDLCTLHLRQDRRLGSCISGHREDQGGNWELLDVAYPSEIETGLQSARFALPTLLNLEAQEFSNSPTLPRWIDRVITSTKGCSFSLLIEREELESPWLNFIRDEGGKQVYCVPLRSAQGYHGVLSFVTSRSEFTQDERDFLTIFAGVLNTFLIQHSLHDLQLAERRSIAEHAISKVLAEASELEQAMPTILQSLCNHLGAEFAGIWLPNSDKQKLDCAGVHLASEANADLQKFAAYSQNFQFGLNQGLPGRVWASGYPLWIKDVGTEVTIPRGVKARETGLVSAIAFPLRLHGEVIGVIELFFADQVQEDPQLLRTLFSIGNEIGHFIQSHHAKNALRMRDSMLRAVSDYARIGLVIIDSEHCYRFVNSYYGEMQGLTETDIVGKPVESILGPLYDEVRPRLQRALAGEQLSFEIRVPAVAEKTQDRWYAVAYRPFEDEHAGKCILSVIVDITERKSAEERKDEFLAVLGHELRNPLAAISGGVQVLDMLDGFSPDAKEMHAVIGRQASVMQRLIDDLLDVTRISRGKIHLRLAPIDLLQLMQNIMEDQRRLIEDRGLSLKVEYPISNVFCLGDATRLNQAIVNVLQNAIKFTEPGGSIRIALTTDEQYASLSIADSGMGMTDEVLARIFEPFSQALPGNERSGGGLGLGLALVKGIIALHNGEVTASSLGEGQGSEFCIRLPLVGQLPTATIVDALPPSGDALRILLVDDRRDAILPALTLLKRDGHAVRAVADGEAALTAVKELMPDVIFCDIGLPGMSGFDVARSLRQCASSSNCFLVALSGFGQDEDRRRALDSGFDLHLTKPISLDKLRHVVQLAKWKHA